MIKKTMRFYDTEGKLLKYVKTISDIVAKPCVDLVCGDAYLRYRILRKKQLSLHKGGYLSMSEFR